MLSLLNRVKSETAHFYLFPPVYSGQPLLPGAQKVTKINESFQIFAARQDAHQEEQEAKTTRKVLAHQSLRGHEQGPAPVYYRDKATHEKQKSQKSSIQSFRSRKSTSLSALLGKHAKNSILEV